MVKTRRGITWWVCDVMSRLLGLITCCLLLLLVGTYVYLLTHSRAHCSLSLSLSRRRRRRSMYMCVCVCMLITYPSDTQSDQDKTHFNRKILSAPLATHSARCLYNLHAPTHRDSALQQVHDHF